MFSRIQLCHNCIYVTAASNAQPSLQATCRHTRGWHVFALASVHRYRVRLSCPQMLEHRAQGFDALRVDQATHKGSVYDVISVVTRKRGASIVQMFSRIKTHYPENITKLCQLRTSHREKGSYATQVFSRIKEQFTELIPRCDRLKINGKGNETPPAGSLRGTAGQAFRFQIWTPFRIWCYVSWRPLLLRNQKSDGILADGEVLRRLWKVPGF